MITSEYQTYGRHIIADAWGIDFDKINNLEFLKSHLEKAALLSGAKVLTVEGKAFEPHGVTVIVVLSESHLSIHTYPEKGFAAIDGYTCGKEIDPYTSINYLLRILTPEKNYLKTIIRGTGELIIKETEEHC